MNEFINEALYPATGIVIATLVIWALKSIGKFAIKTPWKATWVGISLFYAAWGIFSLLYSAVKFIKIPEQAPLHKDDAINIFSFLISYNIIMFFISLGLLYFIMRKIPRKDSTRQDESTLRGETKK